MNAEGEYFVKLLNYHSHTVINLAILLIRAYAVWGRRQLVLVLSLIVAPVSVTGHCSLE